MARFFGKVGYAETVETAPGVWMESITERPYYGDLVRNIRGLREGENVNDDIYVSNNISVLADAYALQNFHKIRYVEFNGAKWKITSIEVQRPRLIFTVGGVYNDHSA